jgi:hypothetical protein
MYVCPQCETEINTSTELCPHCGADLTAEGQPAAPAAPIPLRKILIRWAILLGILAAALWSFLWFVMPSQHGESTAQAESRAVSALANLHGALESYAAAQTGGSFPNSLEPLGEASRAAAQLAQSEGYQIQYTPAPPGADGAIRSYSLQARAGNFGFRNFMTDESGVIRATRENRAATSQDPPL